jgi:SIR2-like domain
LKLHGSIDWIWAETQDRQGHMPQRAIFLRDDLEGTGRDQPALVFGQRGKLRAEGPFLSLLGELETLMSDANRLIVIGYSFRDDHVNEIIQRWTSEDIRRTITVVDPRWPEGFYDAARYEFRATMSRHLIPRSEEAPEFAPRLTIVRDVCSKALPELL